MLVSRFQQLAILALLFLPLSSCEKESSVEQPPQKPVLAEIHPENKAIRQFRVNARRLFDNRNYEDLESLAKQIRKDKECFSNGDWKLVQLIDSFKCQPKDSDEVWKAHEEIIQEWLKKHPDSVTAHVAYAFWFKDYAWKARSSGWASEVTEEGWKLFAERLEKTSELLAKASELEEKCPMVLSCYMTVALGQGWDFESYDTLYKMAKKAEPSYFYYDIKRAAFLLPRWHGEPGQWEADAKSQADALGDLGSQIYAQVVTSNSDYYDNVFSECSISWPDVKAGYEKLISTYPDSPQLLHSYCRLACLANDRAQAKVLFTELGDMHSPGIWKRGEFERAKKWAMNAP